MHHLKTLIANNKHIIILLLLSSFLFLFNLSKAPIELWDEQTNILVVNETIQSDNGLTLILNDKPFFEKPPLWYYSTMGVVKAFGTNITSYRIISALSGILITLILFQIIKTQTSHKYAFWGTLSLLTVSQIVIPNVSGYFSSHTLRSADLDALQLLFIVLAIYFATKIKTDPKNLIYTSVSLALGFMAKGPIILLLAIILITYLFWKRKEYVITKKLIFQSVVAFLLITLPWHIYMYLQFGNDFLTQYLQYHLIQRSLQSIEDHKESIFFYINLFTNFKVNLIWPISLIAIGYSITKIKSASLYFILSIFIVGYLIVITAVQTKLAWYILPIYPFVSGTIGILLYQIDKNQTLKYKNLIYWSIIAWIIIGVGVNVLNII